MEVDICDSLPDLLFNCSEVCEVKCHLMVLTNYNVRVEVLLIHWADQAVRPHVSSLTRAVSR